MASRLRSTSLRSLAAGGFPGLKTMEVKAVPDVVVKLAVVVIVI